MLRRAAFALFAMLAVGCGPKYPACEKDEDCNKEKPRNEYCVNQKCQQCRGDKDCPAGKRCNGGRCDPIPNYCEDDRNCAGDQACVNHKCQACVADAQCGEGGKCKQGKCQRKGKCTVDDDCPSNEECVRGTCSGAPKRASQDAPCKLAPVYFDFNESSLSTEATDAIDKNYQCLKMVGRPVQLIGRSDERGTEEYNLALSERRAQMVRDRLTSLGADSSKLRTLPKGELEATGHDEAGWANDRRVDFEWM